MKRKVEIILKCLEIVFFPITFLVGIYLKFLTKPAPNRLQKSYDWFEKCGWLPIKFHYYQPIINKKMLPANYEKIEHELIGMNLDVDYQINLLNQFHYNDELEKISSDKKDEVSPYYSNRFFGEGSGEILYNMIRHYKPKNIIEIGAGESTKFACLANSINESETGIKTKHVCVEPFENPWLEKLGIKTIRNQVEELDMSLFKDLSQNDILFIDSSHVVRTQGDVVYEYLKIIPSLNKGVIIHCHDIYLPKEYPLKWINSERRYWNEQYLLQALLTHSNRYRILLAGYYLSIHHNHSIQKCCPNYEQRGSKGLSSFYFQVI